MYVREQEGAKSGGVSLPFSAFPFLPHAMLPLFALASVSVTDCHVCVHNAGVCSLPPHEYAWGKKGNGRKGKSAVRFCLHMPRMDRKKGRKT